ncbi:MAG: TIGR04211 family SH3 domain-containing protein [Deltaproteobacteria bacterium]|nr:TIGR04211 family SH3 domain-containing protein [Deltaproteobacteria bacterium]
MRKSLLVFCLLSCAILYFLPPCWASKAYLTDSFEEFTLRSGPGYEYRIITMLSSGQALEVHESQKEWSRVSLPGGDREGWVVSRYLINRVPWSIQANSLREENASLKAKLSQIESAFNEARQEKTKLAFEFEKNSKLLEETTDRYESLKQGADGYLKLKKIHELNEAALKAARADNERLRKEQEELRSSQLNQWFATGALVLLCGLLLGVMIGRQQKTRKSLYT